MECCRSKFFLWVTVLICLIIHHPTLLLVQSRLLPIINDSGRAGDAEEVKVYIVHVQKPAGTKFLKFRDRCTWYMSFLPNSSALDSGKPRMIYMYRDVISGFAARLTGGEVKAMEKMEGFLLAHPERELKPLTTHTPELLGLSTWDGLWPDSSMGEGQIIGVIDTGIKPTHPSFMGHGVGPAPPKWNGQCYWGRPICNNKLIGAVSFKHGIPSSPEDKSGHGTHCAGIAAGNFVEDAAVLGQASGTASGIAPKAHIAAYKTIHEVKLSEKRFVAYSSDILKAMDAAIRDHVDILSMSIGIDNVTLPESSIDIGSFAAVTKGIVPVAAAGNDGPFKSLILNESPWVLTVGASTTDRRISATVKLGDGKEYYGQSAYQLGSPYDSPQLPLVYPGVLKTQETLNCMNGSMDTFDVKGKIVLCGVGQITNVEKSKVVKAAGGAGMILMNQPWNANTTNAEPHVVPTAHIIFDDAWDLLTGYFANDQNPTAAIIFGGTRYGVRPWPTIASFSSRGPSLHNANIIKPDVVAPGVDILSAWPFEVGPNATTYHKSAKTFTMLSGTSMATPHVAGIVALLRIKHPDWSPAEIKSALMTTASVVDSEGKPMRHDYIGTADAYVMGAGLVNPVAADDPGLVYDIQPHDYIAYLCGGGFSDQQVSAIVRGRIICSLINSFPADQLNYPSISVYLGSGSSRTIWRTVKNVGEADSSYKVEYDEPSGVDMDINPAVLSFSQLGEEQSYQVTFSIRDGFSPVVDQYSQGKIAWSSGKYYVRSPIIVTFQ